MHLGKKILQSNEMTLCLLLILFVITIGLINPAFFSIGTMFDVIRNQTIYILLAFGLLPVVILGGLDISFVAVASLATLVSRISMAAFNYDGGMWFFYLVPPFAIDPIYIFLPTIILLGLFSRLSVQFFKKYS